MPRIVFEDFENVVPKSTIFRLWLYTTYNYDGYEQKLPRYPKCEVNKEDLGYFSTLENAEAFLAEYEGWDKEKDIVCYKIIENAVDTKDSYYPVTERVYNHKKEKIDEQLLNQNHIRNFFGRPKEKIRFNVGDLVEYLCYKELILCIVAGLPHTPEKVREYEDACEDVCDDCYLVLPVGKTLDDFDHYHPSPCDLFEPRLKVPKSIKNHLKKRLKTICGD